MLKGLEGPGLGLEILALTTSLQFSNNERHSHCRNGRGCSLDVPYFCTTDDPDQFD